jgi:hypothetical protein
VGVVSVNSGFSGNRTHFEARLSAESDPGKRMDLIDEVLRPLEPQLLDTCVIQNLDWVDRERERAAWDGDTRKKLIERYGQDLAEDLIDLGTLYIEFESQSGYP